MTRPTRSLGRCAVGAACACLLFPFSATAKPEALLCEYTIAPSPTVYRANFPFDPANLTMNRHHSGDSWVTGKTRHDLIITDAYVKLTNHLVEYGGKLKRTTEMTIDRSTLNFDVRSTDNLRIKDGKHPVETGTGFCQRAPISAMTEPPPL